MGSEFWEEGVGTDFVNGCQWPVRDVSAEAAYAHTMCMCVLWLVNFLELVGYMHAFGTLPLGVFVRRPNVENTHSWWYHLLQDAGPH